MGLGSVGKIAPTEPGTQTGAQPGTQPPFDRTSPWGMYVEFSENEKHWPCQQPPWGTLNAVDLDEGAIAWTARNDSASR